MKIDQFTKWKLIYEDEFQCFSQAVDQETDNTVIVISYFEANHLSRPVRLLLSESLHNVLDIIEDSDGFHIVIKALSGKTLKQYANRTDDTYTTRVQMAYEWLKSIQHYEQFPDSVKIQLVDFEQLVVTDNQMRSRELIDYSVQEDINHMEVFKQVGLTLDLLLSDAQGPQRAFIDNLCVGTHPLFSFTLLRKQFKDVFVYEKEEAIQKINYEYHIILNDLESKVPPISPLKPAQSIEQNETPLSEFEETAVEETLVETAAEPVVEPVVEPDEIEIYEPLEAIDEEMPEIRPKQHTIRSKPDFDESLDRDVEDLFDEEDDFYRDSSAKKRKIIFLTSLALVLVLALWGIVAWLMPESIQAKFELDELPNNRVAFMNQSSGQKKIDTYLWEIYYEDTFVYSSTDFNFYPIFETEGDYTISLKVKDQNGDWSESFALDYTYTKNN